MLLPLLCLLLLTPHSSLSEAPDGEEVGIEVSSFNGGIRWESLKENKRLQGITFGLARTSDGSEEDVQFLRNWRGMKNNSLEASAYHVLSCSVTAEEQVKTITRVLGQSDFDKGGDVLAVVTRGAGYRGPSPEEWADTLHGVLEKLESAGFRNLYIGCYPLRWQSGVDWRKYDFSVYKLWLGQWNSEELVVPQTWSDKGKSFTWKRYGSFTFNFQETSLYGYASTHVRKSLATITPTTTGHTETGIDVYYDNGDIDWQKVKRQNVTFAIARATYGEFFEDPKFLRNWQGMRNNNIEASAYHFLLGGKSVQDQVDLIKRVLGKSDFDKDHDVVAVDVEREHNENVSPEVMADTLHGVLEGLKSAGFRHIYIYCGPNFWEHGVAWRQHDFSQYDLWLAHYTSGPPTIPHTWSDKGKSYTWWQHSDKGALDGVSGDVDMNRRSARSG